MTTSRKSAPRGTVCGNTARISPTKRRGSPDPAGASSVAAAVLRVLTLADASAAWVSENRGCEYTADELIGLLDAIREASQAALTCLRDDEAADPAAPGDASVSAASGNSDDSFLPGPDRVALISRAACEICNISDWVAGAGQEPDLDLIALPADVMRGLSYRISMLSGSVLRCLDGLDNAESIERAVFPDSGANHA